MTAQSLSICVPGTACDKKCPYCVSKMTWAPEPNRERCLKVLPEVKAFAERAGIYDVVITGKGEPMLDTDFIYDAVQTFFYFPVVLQTNGVKLRENPDLVKWLYDCGVNTVAISIDEADLDPYYDVFREIHNLGLISRITVVLTKAAMGWSFGRWIRNCRMLNIKQISFREMTVPNDAVRSEESNAAAVWIAANADFKDVLHWQSDMKADLEGARVIRKTSYGATIYDIEGVSVTYFDYCVQDNHGDDDIRSLILNQDGHLYTTWNSPASLLF